MNAIDLYVQPPGQQYSTIPEHTTGTWTEKSVTVTKFVTPALFLALPASWFVRRTTWSTWVENDAFSLLPSQKPNLITLHVDLCPCADIYWCVWAFATSSRWYSADWPCFCSMASCSEPLQAYKTLSLVKQLNRISYQVQAELLFQYHMPTAPVIQIAAQAWHWEYS